MSWTLTIETCYARIEAARAFTEISLTKNQEEW